MEALTPEQYRETGFPVVPLALRKNAHEIRFKKIPVAEWKHLKFSTQTAFEVRRLFSRPHDAIGVLLLPRQDGNVRSHILVLDFDSEGGYEKCRSVLGNLAEKGWLVKTPRGYHQYFRLTFPENEWKLKNGKLKEFDLDLKVSGLIAMPASGKDHYSFLRRDTALPDLITPDELPEIIRSAVVVPSVTNDDRPVISSQKRTSIEIPRKVADLIERNCYDIYGYETRSEAVFAACICLVSLGLTDDEVVNYCRDRAHPQSKLRDNGRFRESYLRGTLESARSKSTNFLSENIDSYRLLARARSCLRVGSKRGSEAFTLFEFLNAKAATLRRLQFPISMREMAIGSNRSLGWVSRALDMLTLHDLITYQVSANSIGSVSLRVSDCTAPERGGAATSDDPFAGTTPGSDIRLVTLRDLLKSGRSGLRAAELSLRSKIPRGSLDRILRQALAQGCLSCFDNRYALVYGQDDVFVSLRLTRFATATCEQLKRQQLDQKEFDAKKNLQLYQISTIPHPEDASSEVTTAQIGPESKASRDPTDNVTLAPAQWRIGKRTLDLATVATLQSLLPALYHFRDSASIRRDALLLDLLHASRLTLPPASLAALRWCDLPLPLQSSLRRRHRIRLCQTHLGRSPILLVSPRTAGSLSRPLTPLGLVRLLSRLLGRLDSYRWSLSRSFPPLPPVHSPPSSAFVSLLNSA